MKRVQVGEVGVEKGNFSGTIRKLVESQEELLPEEELRKRPRLLGGRRG